MIQVLKRNCIWTSHVKLTQFYNKEVISNYDDFYKKISKSRIII